MSYRRYAVILGAAIAVVVLSIPAIAGAPAEPDIHQLIEQYAKAWVEGNPEQMAKTLSPEFARQQLIHTPQRPDKLSASSGLAVLNEAERGQGRDTAMSERQADVKVLDIADGMASALLKLGKHVEYLQLVQYQGQWRITQALTTGEP